jgi:hypothetical protein
MLYAGDRSRIAAIEAETGNVRWRFGTEDWVLSSPTVVDGTVYFGSDDGHVYAVHAADGDEPEATSSGSRVLLGTLGHHDTRRTTDPATVDSTGTDGPTETNPTMPYDPNREDSDTGTHTRLQCPIPTRRWRLGDRHWTDGRGIARTVEARSRATRRTAPGVAENSCTVRLVGRGHSGRQPGSVPVVGPNVPKTGSYDGVVHRRHRDDTDAHRTSGRVSQPPTPDKTEP